MDFKQLKQEISIENFLVLQGLASNMKRYTDKLVGPCPIHKGDNPAAFVVTPSKNLWYCFTRCREGGDLIRLVQRLDNLTLYQTGKYLTGLVEQQRNLKTIKLKSPFHPFRDRLYLNPGSDFLQNKCIYPETSRFFESGEYHGQGFLKGCVAVRLHSPQGQPLGYAGRRLRVTDIQRRGKWKFPRYFPKKKILYNYHRISKRPSQNIVLVECPWGVMRLHQLNIPAVALLGTTLSTTQKRLLSPFKRVILLLDGDEAGYMAVLSIQEQLKGKINTVSRSLPENCDPDDLSDLQLKELLKDFFPLAEIHI
ncbi:toprim domain-containing protein [Candidatus Riflebacteria bacterium]